MKTCFKNINEFCEEFGIEIKSEALFDRSSRKTNYIKVYSLKTSEYSLVIKKTSRYNVYINKSFIGDWGTWEAIEKNLFKYAPDLFKHYLRKKRIAKILNEK